MIPIWVQRMPAIWISFVPGLDPRMPTGAVVLSVVETHAIVQSGQVSYEIAKAWAMGADVEFSDEAPTEIQNLAQRLRLVLPEASRPHLPEIGSRLGVPRIAAAMAAYPTPASIQDLVADVADTHPDGVPRLSPEARLLRALTGL